MSPSVETLPSALHHLKQWDGVMCTVPLAACGVEGHTISQALPQELPCKQSANRTLSGWMGGAWVFDAGGAGGCQ